MRLTYFRVFVHDLSAAILFYRDVLGLELKWEYEKIAAGFDVGAVLIIEEDRHDGTDEQPCVGRFVGCTLSVDDITTTYDALTARGVEFLAPPQRQPWGGVLAHFKDPSGNVLTLHGS